MDSRLPVTNESYEESRILQGDLSGFSADQYLSWVRDEAGRLPLVCRARGETIAHHAQSQYIPKVDEIISCDPEFLPDENWINEAIYTFSALRRTLARMAKDNDNKKRVMRVPPMKHDKSWLQFCLGIDIVHEKEDESRGDDGECPFMEEATSDGEEVMQEVSQASIPSKETKKDEIGDCNKRKAEVCDELEDVLSQRKRLLAERMGLEEEQEAQAKAPSPVNGEWDGPTLQLPTTALLLQFDQVLIQRLLDLHTGWLGSSMEQVQEKEMMTRKREEGANQEQTQNGVDLEIRGQWLYGLLAKLEKPLYHQTAATVRRLYRLCCELRSSLDKNSGGFSTDLPALNVLISITGSYFGQSESGGILVFDDEEDKEEDDEDYEDDEAGEVLFEVNKI